MSPRSQSSTGIDNKSATPPSGDEDEERPTHTSEIGTLKKLPNHGTAWLGSSSGVYFVNTVRRAFASAFTASQALPASEDILTGEDAEGRSYNGPIVEGPSTTDRLPELMSKSFGKLPDRKIAIELIMSFFKAWHPLFPFLHGPSFIKDVELLYQSHRPNPPTFKKQRSSSTLATPDPPAPQPDLRKLLTFQLVINIASLDRTDIQLPPESRIRSTADVLRVAGTLGLDHDLATLQTLLAAQLYLVATLSIRAASTVGGVIIKLVFHAGLHRCPLRYAQLSFDDCQIRKRIFWSAYALDRHCSLSLGDPNTIQDDDIDVCLSGRELHKAVARDLLANPSEEINLHMANPQNRTGGLGSGPVSDDPRVSSESEPEAKEKIEREAALIAYVHWSRLIGRIIDIFHKSINHRFPKQEAIVYLTSDIETWWNDLPSFLTGDDSSSSPDAAPAHLASFFKILYHRLLLLLSRPRLSLDQSTPEFQHGLQVCIRASRNILAGLKAHKVQEQSMFLPGLLSAAWMSGLIIAFAAQLGKYPKARACADIHACLSLLSAMNTRWYTVKNCHKVLTLLLSNIQGRRASTNGLLAAMKPESQPDSSGHTPDNHDTHTSKRRRMTGPSEPKRPTEKITSPTQMTDGTPSDTSSPAVNHNATTSAAQSDALDRKPKNTPSGWSNTSLDNIKPSYDLAGFLNPPSAAFQDQAAAAAAGNQPQSFASVGLGSALYSNPQEAMFAQSSMALPSLDTSAGGSAGNLDDPSFWANMDYNLADVFGSATWETMTGGGFGTGQSGGWDGGFNG